MPRGVYPRKQIAAPKAGKSVMALKFKPRKELTRTQQAIVHLERAWKLIVADVRRGGDMREQDLELKHALVLLTTREK